MIAPVALIQCLKRPPFPNLSWVRLPRLPTIQANESAGNECNPLVCYLLAQGLLDRTTFRLKALESSPRCCCPFESPNPCHPRPGYFSVYRVRTAYLLQQQYPCVCWSMFVPDVCRSHAEHMPTTKAQRPSTKCRAKVGAYMLVR